jgi:hypothetical protein
LGEQKLADTGKGAEARANNRRVELKIYGVGDTVAAQGSGSSR